MDLSDIQKAVGLKSPIRHQLFIDGEFVDALSGETLATLNPHDNSVIAQVAMAGHADVDRAVVAAQKAFPAWSRMQAADRGRILLKLADLIEANGEELARVMRRDAQLQHRDIGIGVHDLERNPCSVVKATNKEPKQRKTDDIAEGEEVTKKQER